MRNSTSSSTASDGGTSTAIFTVASGVATNPKPQVTSLAPASAIVVTYPATIYIYGKDFVSNSTVTFAGVPQPVTTPSDAGQLTITLKVPDHATAGVFPVAVTNPTPGGGTSTFNFTVLAAQPPQPAVTSFSTSQRTYVSGDQFELAYSTLSGATSGNFDLMITILSAASGTTYFYYNNPSDSNSQWLHTTQGPAATGVPKTSDGIRIPSDGSTFPITSDVPSGDYHVKAYFSIVNANQPIGAVAEADFSVATDTPAGGWLRRYGRFRFSYGEPGAVFADVP